MVPVPILEPQPQPQPQPQRSPPRSPHVEINVFVGLGTVMNHVTHFNVAKGWKMSAEQKKNQYELQVKVQREMGCTWVRVDLQLDVDELKEGNLRARENGKDLNDLTNWVVSEITMDSGQTGWYNVVMDESHYHPRHHLQQWVDIRDWHIRRLEKIDRAAKELQDKDRELSWEKALEAAKGKFYKDDFSGIKRDTFYQNLTKVAGQAGDRVAQKPLPQDRFWHEHQEKSEIDFWKNQGQAYEEL